MQKNIYLPQVELTMESVVVGRWLVRVGDLVQPEQPILEVETQKAVAEVPSPEKGFVRKLCVSTNDNIGEKALLCILTDTKDEPFDSKIVGQGARLPSVQTTAGGKPVLQKSEEGDAIRAAPAARKLARDLGVDLATVKGTGPNGRITVEDVEKKMQNVECRMQNEEGWKPLPALRIALNAQMLKSLAEIPQIHVTRQMDISSLTIKAEGITFTHRLVRAAAAALVKHPALRTIIEGNRVKTEPVSVAVAMDTPHGLVAPVVRGAENLSLNQIGEMIRDFRARAELNALRGEELRNGPFAITNLGMFGVDLFSAFVFHGQTAVLAVGRAADGKAWFNLAVDHRVVDGAEAARFLETLQKEILKS